MINPNGNGMHPHVPSHATEFELALALIFKTGFTLLVHHWQPGGLELDNHCSVFCPGFQKGRVPSEKGTLVR